jgi:hypothetical protein
LVFRAGEPRSVALAALAADAAANAGAHHWRSGDLGRAHLTVRALEPYIAEIPEDRRERYLSAAQRAATGLGPVRFVLEGVTLSAGTVMARARPLDGRADDLRQRLDDELGDDGWLERHVFSSGRDPIWYCSVLHFAGPIADPRGLVDWAAAQSDVSVGVASFTALDLCTWVFDGTAMEPRVVGAVSTA